jgi:phosphate:Na+ symporter
VALPLLPWLADWLVAAVGSPALAVALFHTGFNLILAAAFLPLLSPYAALLRRWLPDRAAAADPARPLYLDPVAREVPVVALGSAAREALRMADVLQELLAGAKEALGARRPPQGTKELDDVLSRLAIAIRSYLAALDTESLSELDHRRLQEIVTFVTQMDQAGSVARRILLPHAGELWKQGQPVPEGSLEEVRQLLDRLTANLRLAASLFMTEDLRAARLLAEEKAVFREVEGEATRSHLERLRSGQADSVATSALHLDLFRDIKQINSHVVAAAAYPVLERNGELLPSRVLPAA